MYSHTYLVGERNKGTQGDATMAIYLGNQCSFIMVTAAVSPRWLTAISELLQTHTTYGQKSKCSTMSKCSFACKGLQQNI